MDDHNKPKFKIAPPKNSNPPEDRIRFRKKQNEGEDETIQYQYSQSAKPKKRYIKVKRASKRKDSAKKQKNDQPDNNFSSNTPKNGKKFDYEKFNRKNRRNELRYFHTPEDITKIVYDLITEINSLQEEISELSEKVSKKEKQFNDDQELIIAFKRRNNIQEETITSHNGKCTLDSSYQQERVYTLTKYLNQLQSQMDQLDERYEKDKDYFTNNTLDHLKVDVCMLNHDINEIQTQLNEDQSVLELGQNELQSESLSKGIKIYEHQQKKMGRLKTQLTSLCSEERQLIERREQLKRFGGYIPSDKSDIDKLKRRYNTLQATRKNKEKQLEDKKKAHEAAKKKKQTAKKPAPVVKKENAKCENPNKTFDFISALEHDSQAEIPDNETNSNEEQDEHQTTQSSQDLNNTPPTKQSLNTINNSINNESNDNNELNNSNSNELNDSNHSESNSNESNKKLNNNEDSNEYHNNESNADGDDANESHNNDLSTSGFSDDKSQLSDESDENRSESNSPLKSTGGSFKQSETNLDDDDFEQSDKNEGRLTQMSKNDLTKTNGTNNDGSDDFNDDFDKMNKDLLQMQASIINQLNPGDMDNEGDDDMELNSDVEKPKPTSSPIKKVGLQSGLSQTAKSKESEKQLCDDEDDDIISGSMASMNSTLSASIRNAKDIMDAH